MNIVKNTLREDKTTIGTTTSLNSPVEFLADSGFDFILIDAQHTAVGIKELEYQIQTRKGKKAVPVIRVGENDRALVCYALDIGAKGIIMPTVDKREEAANMVSAIVSIHLMG